MSSKRYIKVEAPDETFAPVDSTRHSSPPRPRLPPRASPPPPPFSPSTKPYPKSFQINQLSQELWETRKEISTAKERERRLQKGIEKLTGSEMSESVEKEPPKERSESAIFKSSLFVSSSDFVGEIVG